MAVGDTVALIWCVLVLPIIEASLWWHGCSLETPQGNCLWISTDQKTFPDSMAACALMDARLAHAQDNITESLIEQSANIAGVRAFWADVVDQVTEDAYVRLDGAPALLNWRSDQPNGGIQQDCIMVDGASAWQWQDKNCFQEYPYVCEHIPQNDATLSQRRFHRFITEGPRRVHSRYAFLTLRTDGATDCALWCEHYVMCTKYYVSVTSDDLGLVTCMLVHWDIPLENPKSAEYQPEKEALVYVKVDFNTDLIRYD